MASPTVQSAGSVASTFVLLALLSAPAAAEVCVDPTRPSECTSSIQGGVFQATAGETVTVFPGEYLENVVIESDKAGLTVRGDPASEPSSIILDPDATTQSGVTVQAINVTIQGFTIRNGQNHGIEIQWGKTGTTILDMSVLSPQNHCVYLAGGSYAGADDTRIEDSALSGCGGDCINGTNANRVTVRNNELDRCDNGVALFAASCAAATVALGCSGSQSSDFAVIEDNLIRVTGDDGIHLEGDAGDVVNNTVRVSDDDGIRVIGSDALVQMNIVEVGREAGIVVQGDDATIRSNRVLSIGQDDTAFEVQGARAILTNNLARSSGSGFSIAGDQPRVEGNQANLIWGTGYSVFCTSCSLGKVSDNVATSATGTGLDIEARGGGLKVTNNRVQFVEDSGIGLSGSAIYAADNRVEFAKGDCFRIRDDSHQLSFNSAVGCQDGYNIRGDGHALAHNMALGCSNTNPLSCNNTASRNLEDGFDVEPVSATVPTASNGIQIIQNASLNNSGVGIEVDEFVNDTFVQGNLILNNFVDLCDDGTDTVIQNNFFDGPPITGPCPID